MRLQILVPSQVLLEEPARKIIAEAQNGHFCLLPRHVDFAAALVPGILTWWTPEGEECFAAVDEGVLVKCGSEVLVSTRNAVRGQQLGLLKQTVEQVFRQLDEQERKSRSALARMEADFARRFWELGRRG